MDGLHTIEEGWLLALTGFDRRQRSTDRDELDRLIGVVIDDEPVRTSGLDPRGCRHRALARPGIFHDELHGSQLVSFPRLRVDVSSADEIHRLVSHDGDRPLVLAGALLACPANRV